MVFNKTRTVFDQYKLFGKPPEDNSKSIFPRKIEVSMSNIFSVEFIKTDHRRIFER